MHKKAIYKASILILILFTVFGVTQHKKLSLVVKNISEIYPVLGPNPIRFVATEHYGNNVLLSWSIPNDKLYSHIEIYYGDSLISSDKNRGDKIKIIEKQKTYTLLSKSDLHTETYFSVYAVDKFGRYSTPRNAYMDIKGNKNALPEGLFKYKYFSSEIKYAYYVLENPGLKAFFSRGVLIGIESKNSDKRIMDVNFNFLNSYLTPLDVLGDGSISFALYRGAYENKLTWIEVAKSNNKLTFTRNYHNDSRSEVMIYTLLDNEKLNIDFQSNFTEKRYALRINTLGNDDFKAATNWTAENVSSIINEYGYADADVAKINSQYETNSSIDYSHEDNLFNDRYPYVNSRVFLKIKPDTKFTINHDGDRIFSIYGSNNEYFFYKNCSGEEDFTFGFKYPYTKGTRQIKDKFNLVLKLEY